MYFYAIKSISDIYTDLFCNVFVVYVFKEVLAKWNMLTQTGKVRWSEETNMAWPQTFPFQWAQSGREKWLEHADFHSDDASGVSTFIWPCTPIIRDRVQCSLLYCDIQYHSYFRFQFYVLSNMPLSFLPDCRSEPCRLTLSLLKGYGSLSFYFIELQRTTENEKRNWNSSWYYTSYTMGRLHYLLKLILCPVLAVLLS